MSGAGFASSRVGSANLDIVARSPWSIPRTIAYSELLTNAATEKHGLPLVRQGAGAEAGFVDLTRQPRPATPATKPTARMEHVAPAEKGYLVGACELLRPEAMGKVEAVQIDVQGSRRTSWMAWRRS
jgi:hypothetical protein